MAINLLALQPHKVSRDLSGYLVYIYGPSGAGKTTFGSQVPNPLLLAFEKGYSTIPGVLAQDITTWGEVKQVLRDLKKPEVKERFKSVIVDTVDIASSLCEKYICNQLDIENIGDGGWAKNGWAKVKKEWEETWRAITMEGYSVIFISHMKDKTFKRKDGTEYSQIVPSCSTAYNEIIKNMVDIMAYIQVENNERKFILRSPDDTIDCKSRFKYIDPVIPFGYQDLVDAMNRAIDKEATMTDNKYITNEKAKIVETKTYDYEGLMNEFQQIASDLMAKNSEYYAPRVTKIVEKYLGKGKKISETTIDQAEFVSLIIDEIKDELVNK